MKTIAMIACTLSLFISACAMQDEPVTDDDTVLPDAGVDPDSGPVDPVCGNDACEDGETIATCEADCSDGAICQQNFPLWAAWSVKDDMHFAVSGTNDDGSAYEYCPGTQAADGSYWAELVGDCAVEKADDGNGISWTNPRRVTRAAGSTEWVTTLSGTPQECVVTLRGCNVPDTSCPGGSTWDAYLCPASPVGVGTQMAGPYVWHGYVDEVHDGVVVTVETGNIHFKRNPGAAAEPRGINPCGP